MLWMTVTLALLSSPALARDLGQWGAEPGLGHEWFRTLMQPDNPFSRAAARPTRIGPMNTRRAMGNTSRLSPMIARMVRSSGLTARSGKRSSFRAIKSNGMQEIQPGTGLFSSAGGARISVEMLRAG